MKLLGKDISPLKVMAYVGERLQVRGLGTPRDQQLGVEGVEPKVDPLTFNLHALEVNADATAALPLETHRDGLAGRAVVLAKRLFRTPVQLFINETLARPSVLGARAGDGGAAGIPARRLTPADVWPRRQRQCGLAAGDGEVRVPRDGRGALLRQRARGVD